MKTRTVILLVLVAIGCREDWKGEPLRECFPITPVDRQFRPIDLDLDGTLTFKEQRDPCHHKPSRDPSEMEQRQEYERIDWWPDAPQPGNFEVTDAPWFVDTNFVCVSDSVRPTPPCPANNLIALEVTVSEHAPIGEFDFPAIYKAGNNTFSPRIQGAILGAGRANLTLSVLGGGAIELRDVVACTDDCTLSFKAGEDIELLVNAPGGRTRVEVDSACPLRLRDGRLTGNLSGDSACSLEFSVPAGTGAVELTVSGSGQVQVVEDGTVCTNESSPCYSEAVPLSPLATRTLVAQPTEGFLGWTGACDHGGSDPRVEVDITQETVTCGARFQSPSTVEVEFNFLGEGELSLRDSLGAEILGCISEEQSCEKTINQGTAVTLQTSRWGDPMPASLTGPGCENLSDTTPYILEGNLSCTVQVGCGGVDIGPGHVEVRPINPDMTLGAPIVGTETSPATLDPSANYSICISGFDSAVSRTIEWDVNWNSKDEAAFAPDHGGTTCIPASPLTLIYSDELTFDPRGTNYLAVRVGTDCTEPVFSEVFAWLAP